jgi:hypothetical protein
MEHNCCAWAWSQQHHVTILMGSGVQAVAELGEVNDTQRAPNRRWAEEWKTLLSS